MRLPNLVSSKIKINEVDAAAFLESAGEYISSLTNVITASDAQDVDIVESLKSELNKLKDIVHNIDTTLSEYKNKIQNEIILQTQGWNIRQSKTRSVGGDSAVYISQIRLFRNRARGWRLDASLGCR